MTFKKQFVYFVNKTASFKHVRKFAVVVSFYSVMSLYGILMFSFSSEEFFEEQDESILKTQSESTHKLTEIDAYRIFYDGLYNKTDFSVGNDYENTFKVICQEGQSSKELSIVFNAKTKNAIHDELRSLFKIFHSNKLFLADSSFLKEIEFDNSRINSSTRLIAFTTYKANTNRKIISFLSNQDSLFLTFGYLYDSIKKLQVLEKTLRSFLPKKCQFKEAWSSNADLKGKKVLAGFYIQCDRFTIHVPFFYTRGSFYWIADDDVKIGFEKIFGDKTRSINKFNLAQIDDGFLPWFFIPTHINQFVYEYGYSEFLECNRELALKLKNSNYKQNYDTNSKMMPTLAYVADYLESTNKHYFLVAGTLLGWFRDCGIIPHTNDLDLAIPDLEYSNSIKKHFIQNRDVYLIIENGLIHVMYELRVYGKHYLLDLFVSYKQNATHAYTGYQTHRTLTKLYSPRLSRFCSCELFTKKFMIPCNPVDFLDMQYGVQGWHRPQTQGYEWKNKEFFRAWTDEEWPHAYKYYSQADGFNVNETRNYLNQHVINNKTIGHIDVDVQ